MNELARKSSATPDLLPWQAALMVACVTAAGLLHAHPGTVRPVVASLETVLLRSGVGHGMWFAGLFSVAL